MAECIDKHFEKIICEKEIYGGKIIRLGLRDVELENGEKSVREIVYHNGGAGILPVDGEGNVYLVRQYRSAFESELLEIPAGKLEKGENPFEAAKRELNEETGFTAKEYISLGEYLPTVGYCTERIYIYLAKGLTSGKTHFDRDEFMSLVKLPFSEAYRMCMANEIKDGKTLIAILKAENILNK